jgi:ElaA protein
MDEFTSQHLYDVLKLRQDIFIIEQECIYGDIDNLDKQSAHLLLLDTDNSLIGYLRIVPAGTKFTECSLGRIAVKNSFRGQGIGKKLVQKGVLQINATKTQDIKIEAQAHLENFYKDIGFVTVSDVYNVDDIPHLQMTLNS